MEKETKKEKIETNVYILGKELKKEQDKENINKSICSKNNKSCTGNSILGLLILFLGFVLILTNLKLISPDFWFFVIPFWPVILILLGLKMILGKNWFSSFITFILALVIFSGIFIYGLVKISSPTIYYLPPEVPFFINNFNY